MRARLTAAVLALLFASQSAHSEPIDTCHLPISDEELEVISVAVNHMLSSSAKSVFLIAKTSTHVVAKSERERADWVKLLNYETGWGETTKTSLGHFFDCNSVPTTLPRCPMMKAICTLAEPQVLLDLNADGGKGWEPFCAKHRDVEGFITASRVGFNEDHTMAIVSVDIRCGVRCGTGSLFLLQRGATGWAVSQRFKLWII